MFGNGSKITQNRYCPMWDSRIHRDPKRRASTEVLQQLAPRIEASLHHRASDEWPELGYAHAVTGKSALFLLVARSKASV
jgi:hypothetical protein